MHIFNDYQWLLERTEQCSNSVLSEAHSNTLKDWHGKAANAFNEQMAKTARKACQISSVNAGFIDSGFIDAAFINTNPTFNEILNYGGK